VVHDDRRWRFFAERRRIVELAVKYRLLTVTTRRSSSMRALMLRGYDDCTTNYVDKILKTC
jgi:hypothetical protein